MYQIDHLNKPMVFPTNTATFKQLFNLYDCIIVIVMLHVGFLYYPEWRYIHANEYHHVLFLVILFIESIIEHLF